MKKETNERKINNREEIENEIEKKQWKESKIGNRKEIKNE